MINLTLPPPPRKIKDYISIKAKGNMKLVHNKFKNVIWDQSIYDLLPPFLVKSGTYLLLVVCTPGSISFKSESKVCFTLPVTKNATI